MRFRSSLCPFFRLNTQMLCKRPVPQIRSIRSQSERVRSASFLSKDPTVRFKRFPQYWGEASGLSDRTAQVSDLVFAITPDPSIRYAEVKAGECHIARYPNPGDLASMKADPNLNVQSGTIADMSYLAFNNQKKPFDDRRVREALIHAVKLPALAETVYQGTGTPTAALIPPYLWGHSDEVKEFASMIPRRPRSFSPRLGPGWVQDDLVGHPSGQGLYAKRTPSC